MKENDYAMIFGYPGGTNRYGNFSRREAEDRSGKSLHRCPARHPPEVHVRGNEKRPRGETAAGFILRRHRQLLEILRWRKQTAAEVPRYGEKQKQEAAFQQWAKGNPSSRTCSRNTKKAYKAWAPYTKERIYLTEGILGSPLPHSASSLGALENAILKKGDVKAAAAAADAARANFLKEENKPSDQKIMAITAQMFYDDIPKDQHPIGFYEGLNLSAS